MQGRPTQFIDGKWQLGTGPLLISRNPATEETLWEGQIADQNSVKAAVDAARKAFPTWANLPIEKRIAYLNTFKDVLNKEIAQIAEIISKETGKPLWESKTEVQGMINKVDISIDAYQKRCPEVIKELPTGRSITRHKPHGVLAVFGPFNFPGHLPHGHIIPALLAGNTVVFKPSELTPLVAETLIHCWEKCNLPAGVLNLVQGGRDTGALLANNPQIDGLCFTGSWETGIILSEQFSAHPEKMLALEMGGNNPLVVSDVSDIKAAVYTIIQSAFLTAGQRCSCARRLIVLEGSTGDAVIQELIKAMKQIKVGPYTDSPEPYMGPVISERAVRHLLAVQETIKAKGGAPLVEMHLLKVDSALLSPGLIDITSIANKADEEIFGPLLRLIRVPNFQAAIEEANQTVYGLTAGLLSKNAEEYAQFYKAVRAGVINWNTPLTGANSAAPFGGIGHSGNHRPSAYYAADYCAYPVASQETIDLKMPPTLPPGLTL